MVYGLYALSSVTTLFCHRRLQNCFRRLDACALERRDHTISPSVSGLFVRSRMRAATLIRPPHPAPTFVTIAKRPSWKSTGRGYVTTNSEKKKEEYFLRKGWTGGIRLKRLAKLAFRPGDFRAAKGVVVRGVDQKSKSIRPSGRRLLSSPSSRRPLRRHGRARLPVVAASRPSTTVVKRAQSHSSA